MGFRGVSSCCSPSGSCVGISASCTAFLPPIAQVKEKYYTYATSRLTLAIQLIINLAVRYKGRSKTNHHV